MTLSKERIGEIAYQLQKINIRRNFSFRDIENAKREIGNLLKEWEIIEKDIERSELLEFGELIVKEVFEHIMLNLL